MENKGILIKKSYILFSKNNFCYKVYIDEGKYFLITLENLKLQLNSLSVGTLKYFLSNIYNYEIFYIFKKINQKMFRIFLKKGSKYKAIKSLINGLISVKYFLNLENYLFNFFFFNIFKLPLNITKKQKGRKTIIIPEVFNPEKLLNVTMHTFYKSILKKKKKNFMNKLNKYFFLEFYESVIIEKDFSYFATEYTTLMFTFLQNRSWMAFQ